MSTIQFHYTLYSNVFYLIYHFLLYICAINLIKLLQYVLFFLFPSKLLDLKDFWPNSTYPTGPHLVAARCLSLYGQHMTQEYLYRIDMDSQLLPMKDLCMLLERTVGNKLFIASFTLESSMYLCPVTASVSPLSFSMHLFL